MAQIQALKAVRGDTFKRTLRFKTAEGVAIDITGWSVFFTIKTAIDNVADDAGAAAKATVIAHTDPTHGETVITLSAAETNSLSGDYLYDIQIKNADNEIITILMGQITFEPEVTRRTTG